MNPQRKIEIRKGTVEAVNSQFNKAQEHLEDVHTALKLLGQKIESAKLALQDGAIDGHLSHGVTETDESIEALTAPVATKPTEYGLNDVRCEFWEGMPYNGRSVQVEMLIKQKERGETLYIQHAALTELREKANQIVEAKIPFHSKVPKVRIIVHDDHQLPMTVMRRRDDRGTIVTVDHLFVYNEGGFIKPFNNITVATHLNLMHALGRGADGGPLRVSQSVQKRKKYDWQSSDPEIKEALAEFNNSEVRITDQAHSYLCALADQESDECARMYKYLPGYTMVEKRDTGGYYHHLHLYVNPAGNQEPFHTLGDQCVRYGKTQQFSLWAYNDDTAASQMCKHFNVMELLGFDWKGNPLKKESDNEETDRAPADA